jgi:hypothetical protein
MHPDDAETTRADVELEDRYGSVTDCTGRILVYDLENADAWVRSSEILDLEECA